MLPERSHEQPDPGQGSNREASELHVERPALHPLVNSIALKSTLRQRPDPRLLANLLAQSQVDRCDQ